MNDLLMEGALSYANTKNSDFVASLTSQGLTALPDGQDCTANDQCSSQCCVTQSAQEGQTPVR